MMKLLLYLILFASLWGCGGSDNGDTTDPKPTLSEASKTMQQLWGTTPFTLSAARQSAFFKIQTYADDCTSIYFKNYLNSLDTACESLEKYDNILGCYRLAFDRVLDGVKNTQVEQGTAVIWMVYNMGYVVKTPTGAFAVDINHRWASKLAPYIDFLCVTHNHSDHYDVSLIQAMFDLGKPVLSNYLKTTTYQYTSATPATYTIGSFNIKTSITDHNSSLNLFVTVFHVDCGVEAANFTVLHVGDSNYKTSQFTPVQGAVDLLIPRYAPNALTENNIIGNGSGQVTPKYVLLSHMLELAHASVEESRWPLELGLVRAAAINCDKTYMPMWGEKLIWKNNAIN